MKILLPLLAAAVLAGCATGPSPEAIANADYGKPPAADYKKQIKDYFEPKLIDPTSPLYTYPEPTKGYMRLTRTEASFGWQVCGTINSKNRMGGYAGAVPYWAFFHEGTIVRAEMGEHPSNEYNFSLINGAIQNACSR